MTSQQTAVRRLRSVGRRRTRTLQRLAALEVEIAETIREADAAGVPKLQIAKEAGVVRQTVYNVLGREDPKSMKESA